jgi:hypothetical protein
MEEINCWIRNCRGFPEKCVHKNIIYTGYWKGWGNIYSLPPAAEWNGILN